MIGYGPDGYTNSLGGFIAMVRSGTVQFYNCVSNISIRSSQDCSGFVGVQYGTLYFINSHVHFNGIISSACKGGFVGWKASGYARLDNCTVRGDFGSGGDPVGCFLADPGTSVDMNNCTCYVEGVECPFGKYNGDTTRYFGLTNVNCPS